MPTFQGSDSQVSVIAGGLTLSEDETTVFFSYSDEISSNQHGSSACHVQCLSLTSGDDFRSCREGDPSTQPSTVVNQKGVTCHYLERHYGVLIWMGVDGEATSNTPFGVAEMYDLANSEFLDRNSLDNYVHPISIASSAAKEALFVLGRLETEADVQGLEEVWNPLVKVPDHTTDVWITRFTQDFGVAWSVQYSAVESVSSQDASSIIPSSIVAFDDFLVVTGSTAGVGPFVGDSADGDHKMDGFLSVLSYEDGSIIRSARVGNIDNDWILGSCFESNHKETDEAAGNAHLFIVGATESTIKSNSKDNDEHRIRAFVAQYRLPGMSLVWIHEFPAKFATSSFASHCTVHGRNIYVGGSVEGGPLEATGTYFGGKDIFVARVDKETGSLEWTRQVGTSGDDELAGIEFLQGQNAVLLYGQSTGNLFGENSSSKQEVALWTMSADGGDICHSGNSGAMLDNASNAPLGASTTSPLDLQKSPTSSPAQAETSVPPTPVESGPSGTYSGLDIPPEVHESSTIDFGIYIILLVAVVFLWMRFRKPKHNEREPVPVAQRETENLLFSQGLEMSSRRRRNARFAANTTFSDAVPTATPVSVSNPIRIQIV